MEAEVRRPLAQIRLKDALAIWWRSIDDREEGPPRRGVYDAQGAQAERVI